MNIRIALQYESLCEQGYAGLEKSSSLTNFPMPMTANNYGKIVKKLLCTTKSVIEVTMQDAYDDFIQLKMLKQLVLLIKLSISCDGSWYRRGHSSLNGVVTLTVISMKNWKVLHVEP